MAIIVTSGSPNNLLALIKKAIDDGEIKTWSYDKEGDFTHNPVQWNLKAWLRPGLYAGELRFGFLKPTSAEYSQEVYSVYHGRFIEMLLAHFNAKYTNALATAGKTAPDNF